MTFTTPDFTDSKGGARLRRERESRGLTIYRAAGVLGVSVVELIKLEAGMRALASDEDRRRVLLEYGLAADPKVFANAGGDGRTMTYIPRDYHPRHGRLLAVDKAPPTCHPNCGKTHGGSGEAQWASTVPFWCSSACCTAKHPLNPAGASEPLLTDAEQGEVIANSSHSYAPPPREPAARRLSERLHGYAHRVLSGTSVGEDMHSFADDVAALETDLADAVSSLDFARECSRTVVKHRDELLVEAEALRKELATARQPSGYLDLLTEQRDEAKEERDAMAKRAEAAEAEIETLRAKLAEAERERDRAKDAFESYRLIDREATARVRAMREACEDACASAREDKASLAAREALREAMERIRALPDDAGTATIAALCRTNCQSRTCPLACELDAEHEGDHGHAGTDNVTGHTWPRATVADGRRCPAWCWTAPRDGRVCCIGTDSHRCHARENDESCACSERCYNAGRALNIPLVDAIAKAVTDERNRAADAFRAWWRIEMGYGALHGAAIDFAAHLRAGCPAPGAAPEVKR